MTASWLMTAGTASASRGVLNGGAVRIFRDGVILLRCGIRVVLFRFLGLAERLSFSSGIAHDVPPVAIRVVSDDAIPPQMGRVHRSKVELCPYGVQQDRARTTSLVTQRTCPRPPNRAARPAAWLLRSPLRRRTRLRGLAASRGSIRRLARRAGGTATRCLRGR